MSEVLAADSLGSVNESSSGREWYPELESLSSSNDQPCNWNTSTETVVSSSINRDITNTPTVHLTALCDMQMEVFLEPIKTYNVIYCYDFSFFWEENASFSNHSEPF